LLGVKDGEDCALTRFSEHTCACKASISSARLFLTLFAGPNRHPTCLKRYLCDGGVAKTAQVGLTLEAANRKIQQEDIFQVMSGVLDILNKSSVSLVGGHTGEGAELAISLAVQGEVAPERVLRKHLSKTRQPVDTDQTYRHRRNLRSQYVCPGQWQTCDQALSSMLQSNKQPWNRSNLCCFRLHRYYRFWPSRHAFEMLGKKAITLWALKSTTRRSLVRWRWRVV